MLGNVATDQGPSRPQVGPALASLAHSCTPYSNVSRVGVLDAILQNFNADVWIEAPVVVNATHVYVCVSFCKLTSISGAAVAAAGCSAFSDTLQLHHNFTTSW